VSEKMTREAFVKTIEADLCALDKATIPEPEKMHIRSVLLQAPERYYDSVVVLPDVFSAKEYHDAVMRQPGETVAEKKEHLEQKLLRRKTHLDYVILVLHREKDPELTCLICGQRECDETIEALVDPRTGQRKHVWWGKHSNCTFVPTKAP
jgi:hypothetical protein